MKFREIFIFVVGYTPQIVTETIYSLAVRKPPIKPSEIILITTQQGKKITVESLIEKKILEDLFKEYKIPKCPIKFEIPQDDLGLQLDDIRTQKDNDAVSNLINRIIKEKTESVENRLHCSIAGGRKTMSFYLGAALQLYGRAQDKLYHVLVSPEFETNRDFFYKPKKNKKIVMPNGKILNTDDAKVELAELPFMRIGEKANIKADSFDQSIKAGQEFINNSIIMENINVDINNAQIKIGEKEIKLPPSQLALYMMLLKLKKSCKQKKCHNCNKCYIPKHDWGEELKKTYEELRKQLSHNFEINIINSANVVASYVSKINKAIEIALNNNANYYKVHYKKNGQFKTKYYLSIKRGQIIFL